jgi:hypothetical protein
MLLQQRMMLGLAATELLAWCASAAAALSSVGEEWCCWSECKDTACTILLLLLLLAHA